MAGPDVTKTAGSVFSFLKSAFVDEVPDAPMKATTRSDVAISSASRPTHVEIDPDVLAKLEKRLQGDLPPVYAKFMEDFESLREAVPDETMRFRAALKTSKASAKEILDALGVLSHTMETAWSDFHKTFEEKKTKVLGQLQTGLVSTDELLKQKDAQLQALQEEIVSLRAKRSADETHLADEERRIDATKVRFEAAHAQVSGRLESQFNRIKGMQ